VPLFISFKPERMRLFLSFFLAQSKERVATKTKGTGCCYSVNFRCTIPAEEKMVEDEDREYSDQEADPRVRYWHFTSFHECKSEGILEEDACGSHHNHKLLDSDAIAFERRLKVSSDFHLLVSFFSRRLTYSCSDLFSLFVFVSQLTPNALKCLSSLVTPGIEPSHLHVFQQMKQQCPEEMRFVSQADLRYIVRQHNLTGKKTSKGSTEAQDLKDYLEKCKHEDPAFQYRMRVEAGHLESAIWATRSGSFVCAFSNFSLLIGQIEWELENSYFLFPELPPESLS
jgi:hypothetical protein